MARILFSASEGSFSAAAQELRAAFPTAVVERLGPDLSRLEGEAVEIGEVANACRRNPLVFVRHLVAEVGCLPAEEVDHGAEAVQRLARSVVEQRGPDTALALQVWQSGPSSLAERSDELWRRLADDLRGRGLEVSRSGQDQILSVVVTAREIIAGLNRREDALTDWPGGRVGLSRSEDQVSRSEFKLEELFKVFDAPLPTQGVALDLGASPGGWTRLLRRRGLRVWAVDPAALDPRVAVDSGVRHVATTAGQFLRHNRQPFDLIVNDMRMSADRSCTLMLGAARHLKPNGLVIMTIKLPAHGQLQVARASLNTLRSAYTILFARQLFHNRSEVTVVARPREEAPARR